jgi:thioredoxin
VSAFTLSDAFIAVGRHATLSRSSTWGSSAVLEPSSRLYSVEPKKTEGKAAPLVSGEELEVMLTEWDAPLVIDAYATWCGPCIIMAPEFEAAAQELKGRVRFVKLDTDADNEMASRLNVMGLPTLMFLDKYEPKEGDTSPGAQAVLKEKIEGAIKKESIVDLCEYLFFDGPRPTNV